MAISSNYQHSVVNLGGFKGQKTMQKSKEIYLNGIDVSISLILLSLFTSFFLSIAID